MVDEMKQSAFHHWLEKRGAENAPLFFAGLSPLAGVSDISFRSLCSEYGADFTVTEMVSAKGLYYGDKKTERLMRIHPKEHCVGCQIFGSDPYIISEVIKRHLNHREDIAWIDLNMGCPAPKITKNGDGSALMRTPTLAYEVLKAMVEASEKPVSVKFRLGYDEGHRNYLEIGKLAEDAGVNAVTVHGRTRTQMYQGQADWEAIAKLVDYLRIPVIGNGDITSPEEAVKRVRETGVKGVAIGRGSMGNPFLFREIVQRRNGEKITPPSMKERRDTLFHMYETELVQKGERLGLVEMRKHLGWWVTGLRHSAQLKNRVNQSTDWEEIRTWISEYFSERIKEEGDEN